jgi:hypothetical protein
MPVVTHGYGRYNPRVSAHNASNPFGRDLFIPLSAGALPLANLGIWAAIRYTGGAHGHGLVIAGSLAAAETALIAWFCATRTERRTAAWSLIGALLNVAVSAAAIMLVTLIVLVIGYAGGRAGD